MKSLKTYIECAAPLTDLSITEQIPPRDEVLPPYTGKKKRCRKLLRKFKNTISENIDDINSIFNELWNLHGAFWKEFYPIIGDVNNIEQFIDKLYEFNFHPGIEFTEYSERYSYPDVQKETELLRQILSTEPIYGILGGHNWPFKFIENIENGKRMSSGCGFMWGDHEPTDWISESISWQDLLNDVPVESLDDRPVFIKNLIYSAEQAAGLMKSKGQILQCVWNSSGRCIQKRSEDGMQDLPIEKEDSLKIKFNN